MSNIVDGTVTFKLRDIRGIRLDSILTSVLDTIYPVGSIYITTNSAPPFSSLDFGAWEEVSSGRVLQGADSTHSAGSTIEAGLPNITGHLNLGVWNGVSGAFKADTKKQVKCAYLDNECISSQSF